MRLRGSSRRRKEARCRLVLGRRRDLLDVSEKTIYRWIKQSKLPAYRINEQYRFNRAELLEWATARDQRLGRDLRRAGEGRRPHSGLRDALERAASTTAWRDGQGVGAAAAVDLMPLPERSTGRSCSEVLLAREALGSTGIGDGIAIPHVRNPIVLHVPRPMVTLCFLEHADRLRRLDGKPVHTLFTHREPDHPRPPAPALALAFALRDPRFARPDRPAGRREEILATAVRRRSRCSRRRRTGGVAGRDPGSLMRLAASCSPLARRLLPRSGSAPRRGARLGRGRSRRVRAASRRRPCGADRGGVAACPAPALARAVRARSPSALDALSAFFLLPILRARAPSPRSTAPATSRDAGAAARTSAPAWFFFNLLVASMAAGGRWRATACSSCSPGRSCRSPRSSWSCSRTRQDERAPRRLDLPGRHAPGHGVPARALRAARPRRRHARLRRASPPRPRWPPAAPAPLFLLAVVGFGTKAGFMPLHVWLPEAHPAAPSATSPRVMSRRDDQDRHLRPAAHADLPRRRRRRGGAGRWSPSASVSGVLGVLFALAQHDLKRLLAYHSVENIGIIALGLGVGLLGHELRPARVAVLGFAGGAAARGQPRAVQGAALPRRGRGRCTPPARASSTSSAACSSACRGPAPRSSSGAAAICGLPPLNGFVSEFLIYLGAPPRRCAGPGARRRPSPALVVAGRWRSIGGLAAACFTKAFGMVFLGEPRSADAAARARGRRGHARADGRCWRRCASLSGLAAPSCCAACGPAVAVVPAAARRSTAALGLALRRRCCAGRRLALAALLGAGALLVAAARAGCSRAAP